MVRRYTGRRRLQDRRVGHPNRQRGAGGTLAAAGRVGLPIIKKYHRQVTKYVKRKWSERRKSTKRRKGNGGGGGDSYGGTNDISRSRRSIGRYPRLKPNRLLKLIKVGMSDRIERFQGITNFDTNCGFFTIANREDSTTGVIGAPIHTYNLTVFKNCQDSGTPILGHAYGWSSNLGDADVVRKTLAGQDYNGTGTVVSWQAEEFRGPTNVTSYPNEFPNVSKILHEWTEVKLNLYGARRRPTWFNIDFVQVKNEFANFSSADGSNPRFIELMNALTGNMTYSNLQTRDTKALNMLKFIRRMKYMIPAETSTDLNTACGKIKEVKIFLKHGRVLNMQPHENRGDALAIGHKQEDGIDYEKYQAALNTPADGAQIFMIIRAWSPSRDVKTTTQWSAYGTNYTPLLSDMFTAKPFPADATSAPDCPSYDMILRQKYSVAS